MIPLIFLLVAALVLTLITLIESRARGWLAWAVLLVIIYLWLGH